MEREEKEITLGRYLGMLSLVLVLSVFSFVMIFSKFEEGINNFWQENEELKSAVSSMGISEAVDADSVEISEDVYENKKRELYERYINSCEDINVFQELFDEYTGEK